MTKILSSGAIFWVLWLIPLQGMGEEFLFLCEVNWTETSQASARCMKEGFGAKEKINESALIGIHKEQLKSMQRRFPEGDCKTKTHRTRMSLDVRTTCKGETRIIEFASIWPLDIRTKQYFRSSMPHLIERKLLEFFKRTHFNRKSQKNLIEWRSFK